MYLSAMSTLAEIEAALSSLKSDEAEELERRLHAINTARRNGRKIFTGHDAVNWWHEREHLSEEDATAFGDDVEAARRDMNRQPAPPTWE